MLMTDLHSLRVLVTRPIRQAQTLAEQLTQCGADVLIHPVLRIEPVLFDHQDITQLIGNSDYIIFTSCNALWHSEHFLKSYKNTLPQCIAIGPATANAITAAGLPLATQPMTDFSSEGLLSIPALQTCQGKQFLLLSGHGGRSILIDELTKRGAFVTKLAVYQRCPGIKPSNETIATWQKPGIDVVISTSGEGLSQLVTQCREISETTLHWLLKQQLLLMSQRLVPLAQQLGFIQQPLIASSASDDGIVNMLAHFVKHGKGNDL